MRDTDWKEYMYIFVYIVHVYCNCILLSTLSKICNYDCRNVWIYQSSDQKLYTKEQTIQWLKEKAKKTQKIRQNQQYKREYIYCVYINCLLYQCTEKPQLNPFKLCLQISNENVIPCFMTDYGMN